MQDSKWAKKPASIPNKGLLTFKNAASQNHFIAMAKLKKGMTYRTSRSGSPPLSRVLPGRRRSTSASASDSGVVSPGHSATFKYNVPKGDYVMVCFWPDATMGGMPHVFMGMHRVITVK